MILRDRGAALLVLPKDFIRSETDSQVVTQSARFFEKLNMAAVKDVVTPGDKDSFHGNRFSEFAAALGEVKMRRYNCVYEQTVPNRSSTRSWNRDEQPRDHFKFLVVKARETRIFPQTNEPGLHQDIRVPNERTRLRSRGGYVAQ